MSNIERIKSKIEERIAFFEKCADAACEKNLHNTFEANELLIRQYKSLLTFIDSLPEEKPIENDAEIEKLIARDIMEATVKRVNIDKQDKDKEEEARLYAIPHYMKDIDVNHIEEYPYDSGLEAAFIAGAEWQYQKDRREFAKIKAKTWCEGFDAHKQQMLKDAVECDIIVPIYEENDTWSAKIKIPGRYGLGDKVRIIIVKED